MPPASGYPGIRPPRTDYPALSPHSTAGFNLCAARKAVLP